MKVITGYVCPPIPTTQFDWMAYYEGDEEGPTGRGATELEAVTDLCEQVGTLWMEAA